MSEILVAGGGLAGGAAATALARAGHRVRLIEREAGSHDKVCGEFLSVEAQRDIAALGIDLARLGAVPVGRVRLVAHGWEAETSLPFRAMGISRRVLDEALLEAAAAAGAVIERGVRVKALRAGAVATSDGERNASRILLATGKHALRGVTRTHLSAARDGYVGFKMHWRLPPNLAERLAGFVELLIFAGGYAGLQLVGPRTANLCLIVRRRRLAQAGGNWDGLLAGLMRDPAFGRRLDGAMPAFTRPHTIANLPYGYLCDPRESLPEGIFRLGDQAAMTASLTGDGMAAALLSARLAAQAIDAGQGGRTYHTQLASTVGGQVRRAMALQRFAELPLAMRLAMPVLKLCPQLVTQLAGATRLPQWR